MKIRSHKDLDTYKIAFESAMKIFEVSKSFPKEEKYFYPVKYFSVINYQTFFSDFFKNEFHRAGGSD